MAHLGTVAIVGLLGVGVYAYAKHRQKKDEEKKLKAKKPARVNNVELWTKLQDLPDPPFVGLLFCDNAAGRAILEKFTTVGRTYKGPTLFAISTENMGEGSCGEGEAPAILAAQRVIGSWRESISGEDQAQFQLLVPNENKMRSVLAWSMGDGDFPVDHAVWIGEESVVWKNLDEEPPLVEVKAGMSFEFPVTPPAVPGGEPFVEVMSSNPDVAEVFYDAGDGRKRPTVIVQPFPLLAGERARETTITATQDGWAKHMLLQVKA